MLWAPGITPHSLVGVYQNCGAAWISTSIFRVEVATVLSCTSPLDLGLCHVHHLITSAVNIKPHSFRSSAIWVTNQLFTPLIAFLAHSWWQQGCTVWTDKGNILYRVQQLPQKQLSHKEPASTMNSKSTSPLQVSLAYFIEVSKLWLPVSKWDSHFWKYFFIHIEALVVKY
jgi:hypothetical protein